MSSFAWAIDVRVLSPDGRFDKFSPGISARASVGAIVDASTSISSVSTSVASTSMGSASMAASLRTPLGSVWKLFAYAYQSESQKTEPNYVCKGDDPEEIFCCSKNQSIGRVEALAKSCSPYFSPTRLKIDRDEWQKFWSVHGQSQIQSESQSDLASGAAALKGAPLWLTELRLMRPETRVPVNELLSALQTLRKFQSFSEIEKGVGQTVIDGTAKGAVKTWGSTLRVKTFTWRDENLSDQTPVDRLGFAGGFVGWLPDQSAIWVSNPGHGRNAFDASQDTELRKIVDRHAQLADGGCVKVAYFDHYSIVTAPPSLRGPIDLQFTSGTHLKFFGDGSLHFEGKKIVANLSENEYIARVLDREVMAKPLDAARAFALLARTFLYQNGRHSNGCFEISDSSRLQRVSPVAASAESLKIARWSESLFLEGVPNIRYHSTKSAENRLAWTEAVKLARAGFSMPEILHSAYPASFISFGFVGLQQDCELNLPVAAWVAQQSRDWLRNLNLQEGFEAPKRLRVCKVRSRISSDLAKEEIFVPFIRSRDDELSVLHEYLHVGFKNHPRGHDEIFIEQQARALLEDK